jgi:serine protease
MTMGRCLSILLASAVLALTTHVAAAQYDPASELLVALKAGTAGSGLTAEKIVAVLALPASDVTRISLRNRLGRPSRASFLIRDRVHAVVRAELGADRPQEQLQRYVVLGFASFADASAAQGMLRADPDVEHVSPNLALEFAQAPGDPLFYPPGMPIERSIDYKLDEAIPDLLDNTLNPDRPQATPAAADPIDYQWQYYDTNFNFRGAWAEQRGTATIAHLDNGIQLNPLHPDLTKAWRPNYAYNIDGTTNVDELANTPAGTTQAGHGTHTAGLIAANTNVPLSPYPAYPNAPAVGVAAGCWFCNLMVIKVSYWNGLGPSISISSLVPGLERAIRSGAQVANMSLGISENSDTPTKDCTYSNYRTLCTALAFAEERDVVVVAAAGNKPNKGFLDFPAIDPRTIAVGGIQGFAGNEPVLWRETGTPGVLGGSSTGTAMQDHGVVAAARYVLSSVYTGHDWAAEFSCGDSSEFRFSYALGLQQTTPGSSAGAGYGSCSGTSMSTAIISGLAGLVRSSDPLMRSTTVRGVILAAGSHHETTTNEFGHGFVDAGVAIANALGQTVNRLTPLFSFRGRDDYFYTVYPQMGAAAYYDTLQPRRSPDFNRYVPIGETVQLNLTLPGTDALARAQVWLFVNHRNPKSPSNELKPLYRLSYLCGQNGVQHTYCLSDGNHVVHAYSTDLEEAQQMMVSEGYELDGIEGYVYPSHLYRPDNSVELVRAYSLSKDDYAVFPGTVAVEQAMTAEGYTSNRTILGYVYLNDGCNRPSY